MSPSRAAARSRSVRSSSWRCSNRGSFGSGPLSSRPPPRRAEVLLDQADQVELQALARVVGDGQVAVALDIEVVADDLGLQDGRLTVAVERELRLRQVERALDVHRAVAGQLDGRL